MELVEVNLTFLAHQRRLETWLGERITIDPLIQPDSSVTLSPLLIGLDRRSRVKGAARQITSLGQDPSEPNTVNLDKAPLGPVRVHLAILADQATKVHHQRKELGVGELTRNLWI